MSLSTSGYKLCSEINSGINSLEQKISIAASDYLLQYKRKYSNIYICSTIKYYSDLCLTGRTKAPLKVEICIANLAKDNQFLFMYNFFFFLLETSV